MRGERVIIPKEVSRLHLSPFRRNLFNKVQVSESTPTTRKNVRSSRRTEGSKEIGVSRKDVNTGGTEKEQKKQQSTFITFFEEGQRGFPSAVWILGQGRLYVSPLLCYTSRNKCSFLCVDERHKCHRVQNKKKRVIECDVGEVIYSIYLFHCV